MSFGLPTRERFRLWLLLLLGACVLFAFTVAAFHEHELSRETNVQAPCAVCEIVSTLAVAVFAIGLAVRFRSFRLESTPETHSYCAIGEPWAYIRPPPTRALNSLM